MCTLTQLHIIEMIDPIFWCTCHYLSECVFPGKSTCILSPKKFIAGSANVLWRKWKLFSRLNSRNGNDAGCVGLKARHKKMEVFFLPGIITPLFLKPLFVDVIGFLSLPCSRVFKQHQRVDRFLR